MFFMFDGMSLIYYIKDLINLTYYNYHYYFKGFLLFLILIPITVNAITLYLLDIIEKKDKISNHKLIPSILNRYINYLIKDGNNKELLNYYKGRCKAELIFYIFILILYFISLKFSFSTIISILN